jgi:predicted DNA-binding transcriptional regulator AlpA
MNQTNIDIFIPRTQARRDYFGGISADTVAKWQAAGKLPPLIRVSRKVVGWKKSTLDAFMESRKVATP